MFCPILLLDSLSEEVYFGQVLHPFGFAINVRLVATEDLSRFCGFITVIGFTLVDTGRFSQYLRVSKVRSVDNLDISLR